MKEIPKDANILNQRHTKRCQYFEPNDLIQIYPNSEKYSVYQKGFYVADNTVLWLVVLKGKLFLFVTVQAETTYQETDIRA